VHGVSKGTYSNCAVPSHRRWSQVVEQQYVTVGAAGVFKNIEIEVAKLTFVICDADVIDVVAGVNGLIEANGA
jgi:ribosomal protein L7Ae-like RNA K-turn-binding protein